MADTIRNVHPAEFSAFMRFLERCYLASIGTFERSYPHLYRPDEDACACWHVLEHNGQIVSHVGLYPIEMVINGVSLTIAGIGAVGTLPEARGNGYMTRLLGHVIDVMREHGYPLSWLGGDRQRYNNFGWELAGTLHQVHFTQRSLDRVGVEGVPLQEVRPEDAEEQIAQWQPLLPCRARQPHLGLFLRRSGLRAWLAEDGYVLFYRTNWGRASIVELVSASAREAEMIRSLLSWYPKEGVRWDLSPWDRERLVRVLPAASYWESQIEGMYRIVDLASLLVQARPALAARASGLRDMEVTLEIHEPDRVDAATLVIQGGQIEVEQGCLARRVVELTPLAAARLLLGGPPTGVRSSMPPELEMLFPIPAHVPPLSHV